MSASMETDTSEDEFPGRWRDIQKLLTRGSPLAHPEFEPSEQTHQFLRDICKLLVIGAGGLGCELLKDLALLGFTQIHVIDMDIVDLSNLNRQFLFSEQDIGKPKAEVAAKFVSNRVAGCTVTPHFCKIQDFDMDFYRQFHIIVCGLDSIVARRWINGMVLSLLRYDDDDGELDQTTIIPLIDGGTEGFKGNARVILPGLTACVDCTLDLYPPQVNYPLCTIASKPRLPEHCVEYAKILQWPKEKPFGEGVAIDGDNPDHLLWLYEKAQDRAKEYRIEGVTFRLTQGVVKRIIPAVASTNAVIAAVCATEAFKLATSKPLQNYMMFNDSDGVYTYTFEAEKKEDCVSCSTKPVTLTFTTGTTLQEVYDYLRENQNFMMKAPSITTVIDGKNKTLYMPTLDAIEKATRPHLKEKLTDLGVLDGCQLVVADATTPKSMSIIVKLEQEMELHTVQ